MCFSVETELTTSFIFFIHYLFIGVVVLLSLSLSLFYIKFLSFLFFILNKLACVYVELNYLLTHTILALVSHQIKCV
jgi:uncharacterized membrane protein YqhA